MNVIKTISVGQAGDALSSNRLALHLTGNERVSMLEDLRREAARIFKYEYPERMQKVISVVDRDHL